MMSFFSRAATDTRAEPRGQADAMHATAGLHQSGHRPLRKLGVSGCDLSKLPSMMP